MVMGMLKTLTYGQKMQISEGKIAVPLDRDDIENWVTLSEERNEKAGKKIIPKESETKAAIGGGGKKNSREFKEKSDMTATKENCTPREETGYFNFNPPVLPQATCFFHFNSCCCEDGTGGLLEALYQFALTKKASNPGILKVLKKWSPNGACSALEIHITLIGNSSQTLNDYQSIASYYLTLLSTP